MKQLWNIIGAIAGILAVAVAVFVFLSEKNDKIQRLEVTQVSRTSLVNPTLAAPPRDLEILYDGRKISDYTVLQYRFANAGGQPIRSADYETSLGLEITNIKEILWAEQTSSDPHSLTVQVESKNNTVNISNSLLNPNDWFAIEVAVVPEVGKIPTAEPVGRIAGVKQIEYILNVPDAGKEKGVSEWVQYFVYIQAVLVLVMLSLQWFRYRRIYSDDG